MRKEMIQGIYEARNRAMAEVQREYNNRQRELDIERRNAKDAVKLKYGAMLQEMHRTYDIAEAKPVRDDRNRKGFYAGLARLCEVYDGAPLLFNISGKGMKAVISFVKDEPEQPQP